MLILSYKGIWNKLICIFGVLIIFIVCLKKILKSLDNELLFKKSIRDGFTSTLGDNLESIQWPIIENTGLKPLVLKNRLLPIYSLGVSAPGSVSYIVGQYFQRKIYPVKLIYKPSSTVLLYELGKSSHQIEENKYSNSLREPMFRSRTKSSGSNMKLSRINKYTNLDLGFIREPQLLELSRIENGIKSISVLAPAYTETLYLIGNKQTNFSGLSVLKRNTLSNQESFNNQKIGVLRDSLLYWDAIIRALDLEIGRDYLKAENDDLAVLLQQLERGELNAVFFIGHTFDSRFQAFLKTNEIRMLNIYPTNPYPTATDMITRPYNPETTDLIAKFKSDMKIFIPWIFEENISLGTLVNIKNNNVKNEVSGSNVYKTFKIRSYLCASRILARDTEYLTTLGKRYLDEYQSLGLLIQEWGTGSKKNNFNNSLSANNSILPKQLVLPTVIFSDYDSFNPDLLGAIPTEININPIMAKLIADIYGRIKIETSSISCDI